MPSIASVSVKYGRKYQVRKDDWVSFEALITLTVSAEEANVTDPREVTAQAFTIARESVREQAADLRRQIAEAQQRAAAPAPPPATRRNDATPPPAESEPPFPAPAARRNDATSPPATGEPPFPLR